MSTTFRWIVLIICAVVIGFLGNAGYKHFEKKAKQIAFLEGENSMLKKDVAVRNNEIAQEKNKVDSLKLVVAALQKDFKTMTAEKEKISKELKQTLIELNGITSDSSYIFLQRIAYDFPGTLKYLFNELQVRGIHKTFVELQASTHLINNLESQVINCSQQVQNHEKIENGLGNIIDALNENVDDYKDIVENDSLIIRDQGKLIKSEHRRKNFWRTTTGASILVIIGLIL